MHLLSKMLTAVPGDFPGGPMVKILHCTSSAVGVGSVPGWVTKIPHAVQCGQIIQEHFLNK